MLTNGRILFFYTDGRLSAQDFDSLEFEAQTAFVTSNEQSAIVELSGVREIRILLRA
jgi:hypothetical protein